MATSRTRFNKINFLQWAGLRYSIPSYLKVDNLTTSAVSPSFLIGNNIFDVKKKKSKDYYSLLVSKKAQPPKIIHKLQSDFDFKIDQFRQIFSLPHSVALESYVKAFQYKVIHSILYTNTKLYKIGYILSNDLCTFYDAKPDNLYHLFYECSLSMNQRISESANQRINESTNQRINESTNQRINESTNQRINESTNQRINESTNHRINESTKSTNQRINELTNQRINESTNQRINESTNRRINEFNESTNQRINQ